MNLAPKYWFSVTGIDYTALRVVVFGSGSWKNKKDYSKLKHHGAGSNLLKRCFFNYNFRYRYRYQLSCIFTVAIFQFFPPGSGSIREIECGSGSTALENIVEFSFKSDTGTGICWLILLFDWIDYKVFRILKILGPELFPRSGTLKKVVSRHGINLSGFTTLLLLLSKGMMGHIVDLAFAHNKKEVVLGCVDDAGNLFVYKILETQAGRKICDLSFLRWGKKSQFHRTHFLIYSWKTHIHCSFITRNFGHNNPGHHFFLFIYSSTHLSYEKKTNLEVV